VLSRREDSFGRALKELDRQASFAFFVSIAIYTILASTIILASSILLASLLLNYEWPVIVAGACTAAVSFMCLLLMQLSPLGRRQQRLAVLIAQTEAAGRALGHNFELWDAYLRPRLNSLKPEQMALAVDSLSQSSQIIIGELASLAAATVAQSPATVTSPPPKDSNSGNPAIAAKY
jgi:hypothetical protein